MLVPATTFSVPAALIVHVPVLLVPSDVPVVQPVPSPFVTGVVEVDPHMTVVPELGLAKVTVVELL